MEQNIGAELQPGKSQDKVKLFIWFLVSVLGIALWIWGLNLLFLKYTKHGYFIWYVKNGTLIGILTAFFTLVWQGNEEEQKGLLSWHPLGFLASCSQLAGVLFAALAVNNSGPLDGLKRRADNFASISEALWDGVFGFIMSAFMTLAVFGWLLVLAPGFYLVALITGAPARREMRDTGRRLMVKTEGAVTSITEQLSSSPVPDGSIEVSFGARPFALTNALSAAVLFFAQMLIKVPGGQ